MTDSDLCAIALALKNTSPLCATAVPRYDGMANAIFWSDELDELDVEIVWKLRPVLRARTCKIIGVATEFADELAAVQGACKSWKGFCDARMQRSESLTAFFKDKEAHFLDGFEDSTGW